MAVDEDRRSTNRDRRSRVIAEVSKGFQPGDPESPVGFLKAAMDSGTTRTLVANADVDGLISSMMLAAVSDWRVGILVDKTRYSTAPELADTDVWASESSLFGVDIYSSRFGNVSNHPVFFGFKPGSSKRTRGYTDAFDKQLLDSIDMHRPINLSAWTGISASRGSSDPQGMPYKYPLGTAQLLLAVLESSGHGPRFFDRQFLPWMVANCDGGVDTIRAYAWNAEIWWSALAAVVGPQSQSEQLYQLVTHQRPGEFMDVHRRLRYEDPERSKVLNSKWNLVNTAPETIQTFIHLVSDLSGWPDPFVGGVDNLASWSCTSPTRNVLPVAGLTKVPDSALEAHLTSALDAIHMNFSSFKERGTALGWMLPVENSAVEELLGNEAPEEETEIGEEPAIPDADE